MEYILAIDETGIFNTLGNNDKSFIGGILIEESDGTKDINSDSAILNSFRDTYIECKGSSAPSDIRVLLDSFHYSGPTSSSEAAAAVDIAGSLDTIKKNLILPYVKAIFKSTGKPLMVANNQDWWKSALVCVISEALKKYSIKEIRFDSRATTVLGLGFKGLKISETSKETKIEIPQNIVTDISEIKIESDKKGPRSNGMELIYDSDQTITMSLKFNKENWIWKKYHKHLEDDLKLQFNVPEICSSSNSTDECVALADLVCGFVSHNLVSDIPIIECPCTEYDSGVDPMREKNPIYAIASVLQNSKNQKKKIIENIFSNIGDENIPDDIWDMFYDFVKDKIKNRDFGPATNVVVQAFLKEFKNRYIYYKKEKIKNIIGNSLPERFYKLMNVFDEYYSHCGNIKFPLSDNTKIIREIYLTPNEDDGRPMLRWTNYISHILRIAEIHFNAYDFESTLKLLELDKIYNAQEEMLHIMQKMGMYCKDENLTALIGTIGQSYAFRGMYDEAIDYFNKSLNYAIKSKSQSYSYLITVSILRQDFDVAKSHFTGQTKFLFENYTQSCIKTGFDLLSYCRLRALDAMLKIGTSRHISMLDFKNVIEAKENSRRGRLSYEFYLAMKWMAVAWLYENEDKQDKTEAVELFSKAIDNLMNSGNFTLMTLALPIVQCLARIEPDNEHCRNYAQYMQELTKQSEYFARYMDKHAEFKKINNKASLWDCATFLPFIYS